MSILLYFGFVRKSSGLLLACPANADEIFGGYPWFHREDDLNRAGFPWMRSTDERVSLLKTGWREKLKLEEYAQEAYLATLFAETPKLEGESGIAAKRRELFLCEFIMVHDDAL